MRSGQDYNEPKTQDYYKVLLYKLFNSTQLRYIDIIISKIKVENFVNACKLFRVHGKNALILALFLAYDSNLSYEKIKRLTSLDNPALYLRRLRAKNLVEKNGKTWQLTQIFKYVYYNKNFDKKQLENLRAKAQAIKEQKIGIRSLVKVTYCYASHGRKYIVKNTKANLKEELEKITKDLQQRFPERGYELAELPITASKVYCALEKQKDYMVLFHVHQNNVEVYVKYRDFVSKQVYILWILRTLLYKLRLLELVKNKK